MIKIITNVPEAFTLKDGTKVEQEKEYYCDKYYLEDNILFFDTKTKTGKLLKVWLPIHSVRAIVKFPETDEQGE